MTQVGTIQVTCAIGSVDSAISSARLVGDVLAAGGGFPHALAERFPNFINPEIGGLGVELRFEASDLIRVEPVSTSALGTCEFVLKPSDRYLDFVAAVSVSNDVPFDFDLHGWPILSSVGCSTTMADGAAESIRRTESAGA